MGSCLSLQDSDEERRIRRQRQGRSETTEQVFSTVIVTNASLPSHVSSWGQKAYYGEYVCGNCGRYWNSTLSWHNAYQRCKRCQTDVYPKNQREVREGDIKKKDGNKAEHAMELCQKCKSLGYNCGKYNSANKNRNNTQVQLRSRYTKRSISSSYYL